MPQKIKSKNPRKKKGFISNLLEKLNNAAKNLKKNKNPVIETIGKIADFLFKALVNFAFNTTTLAIKAPGALYRLNQESKRDRKAIEPNKKGVSAELQKPAVNEKGLSTQPQKVTTNRLKRSASTPDLSNAAGNTTANVLRRSVSTTNLSNADGNKAAEKTTANGPKCSVSAPDLSNAAGNRTTNVLKRSVSAPNLSNAAENTTAKTTAVGRNSVVSRATIDMGRLTSTMKLAARLPAANSPSTTPKLNPVSRGKENSLKSNITGKRRHSFAV